MPEFFIRFLTEPGQLVLDPFAGSNVTGFEAEKLGRRWLGIEINADYIAGSRLRFEATRSVPPRSVPQQREVPREAVLQVQVQIVQQVGVVEGEGAGRRSAPAWPLPTVPLDVGEGRADARPAGRRGPGRPGSR